MDRDSIILYILVAILVITCADREVRLTELTKTVELLIGQRQKQVQINDYTELSLRELCEMIKE